MAAFLTTSLLATACPRPDAQPAVLATSAIFVNNTPSAARRVRPADKHELWDGARGRVAVKQAE